MISLSSGKHQFKWCSGIVEIQRKVVHVPCLRKLCGDDVLREGLGKKVQLQVDLLEHSMGNEIGKQLDHVKEHNLVDGAPMTRRDY